MYMKKYINIPQFTGLMSIFDDMLKDGESLFRDEIPLDFSFIPKPLKYRENEQRIIQKALRKYGGNISSTSRELGINRSTLYEKIKKYGL